VQPGSRPAGAGQHGRQAAARSCALTAPGRAPQVGFNVELGGYFSIKRNAMSIPGDTFLAVDQVVPYCKALLEAFRRAPGPVAVRVGVGVRLGLGRLLQYQMQRGAHPGSPALPPPRAPFVRADHAHINLHTMPRVRGSRLVMRGHVGVHSA
jgi:hypothetical protein